MNILHTSDWHLGRQLYGQSRHAELSAFLDWLQNTMRTHHTDVLLIAGDVFDTITPNHAAQTLYYNFLAQVATQKLCRHIVIIGGNHDSASFLNAPQTLLSALNVTVIGACTEEIVDEMVVLRNQEHQIDAIICAVPYLRDRDVRLSQEGQSIEDNQQALIGGIHQHYQQIFLQAAKLRAQTEGDFPIIAMGHLFTQGGITLEADGVRELYVGTLAHVGASAFDGFDYVALGHLHVPQMVGNQEHIRYSGSPIAMGFGEANQQKQVLHVAFTGRLPHIHALNIPVFHALKRITGNETHIKKQLHTLIQQNEAAYVEVVYQGDQVIADLHAQLQQLTAQSNVKILRLYNRQFLSRVLPHDIDTFALPDLTPEEVFDACLEQHKIDADQRQSLKTSYQTVLQQIQQQGEGL